MKRLGVPVATPRADPPVSGVGEDRLVATLLAALPASVKTGAGVHSGPGDDCAVVGPIRKGRRQLLKTDCLIEGIHFSKGTGPGRIGWKAICRPLSDIAAMGGEPAYALVTLALDAGTPLEHARAIYAGIGRAAREFGVKVVGGETARSPCGIFLSICITGTAPARKCVPRAGGRAGGGLYVTGRLGGSFASGRHLKFKPRLAEGQWLAAHFTPTAMMDLSDGLAADLPRLARASGTGFRLDRDAIPRSRGCSIGKALSDGEDYELLFAIAPSRAAALGLAWKRRFPRLTLTRIGELTPPGTWTGLDGAQGHDHFGGRPRDARQEA